MKKLLYVFTFIFSLSAVAGNKEALVDKVLEQSSMKITIMNLPAQMSQMPAMMPIEGAQKQQFVQDLVTAMQSSFNEVKVYNAVRQYFIDKGDEAHLAKVLEWLQSPAGKEATTIEILAGQQDMVAMQNYMMSFNPANLDSENLALYKEFIESSQITEAMFKLMEKMLPKMIKTLAKQDSLQLQMGKVTDAEIDAMMAQQMTVMRQQMGPMLEMQMLASLSYMYKDLSATSMSAYNQFLATDAGQHYIEIGIDSVFEYGMDWMVDMMVEVIKVIEEAELEKQ